MQTKTSDRRRWFTRYAFLNLAVSKLSRGKSTKPPEPAPRPPRRCRKMPLAALAILFVLTTFTTVAVTASPASAQQDRVLFDFSRTQDQFWTFAKPGTGAEISGLLNGGNLILETELPQGGSVAWTGRDPTVTDWRNHDALRFVFRGLNTGSVFKIVFQEGSDLERFEYSFRDDSSTSRIITAHLDDFVASSWQPNGQRPEGMDKVDVRKFLIQVRGPGRGRLAIGSISLVHDDDGVSQILTEPARNKPNNPDPNGGLLQLGCTGDRNFTFRSIDPIVQPGVEPTHHQHMFVGNQELTPQSVNVGGGFNNINRDSDTTCPGGQANLSGYWVPTLFDGRGNAMIPNDVNVYYKRGSVDNRSIQNFPTGLKMVAGDLPGTATPPDGNTVAYWSCRGGGQEVGVSRTIPSCTAPAILRMFVVFPQCWNNRDLYSTNGAHMAYAEPFGGGGRLDGNSVAYYRQCPASHPTTLPEINYQFHYNMQPGQDSRWWRLSSPTLHGDWMNGWDANTFQQVIDNCMKAEPLQCQDQLSRTVQLVG